MQTVVAWIGVLALGVLIYLGRVLLKGEGDR